MAHKKGIFIILLAIGLMLASISCAAAQVPPQQTPRESQTPTPSQPTQTPWGLGNLTDAEKAKVIQIALNTPEAKSALETYTTYKAELQWAAIVWEGSVIKERQVHILFHFGEIEPGYPEGRFLVDVTVDLVNEKAVGLVVTHPLKPLPVYYLIQIQNKTEQSLSIFINDTYIGDVLPGAEITNYKAWFTTIFNIKAESLQGQILFKQEITLEEMKKIDWKVVIPPLQNK